MRGTVQRVQVVTRWYETVGVGADRSLGPVGGWELREVPESPRGLGPRLGWRRVIVIGSWEEDDQGRRAPKLDQASKPDIVSSSLAFEGPEPGGLPVAEEIGLLFHVDVDVAVSSARGGSA